MYQSSKQTLETVDEDDVVAIGNHYEDEQQAHLSVQLSGRDVNICKPEDLNLGIRDFLKKVPSATSGIDR